MGEGGERRGGGGAIPVNKSNKIGLEEKGPCCFCCKHVLQNAVVW